MQFPNELGYILGQYGSGTGAAATCKTCQSEGRERGKERENNIGLSNV